MATDEGAGASRQQPLLVLGKITEILDAFLAVAAVDDPW